MVDLSQFLVRKVIRYKARSPMSPFLRIRFETEQEFATVVVLGMSDKQVSFRVEEQKQVRCFRPLDNLLDGKVLFRDVNGTCVSGGCLAYDFFRITGKYLYETNVCTTVEFNALFEFLSSEPEERPMSDQRNNENAPPADVHREKTESERQLTHIQNQSLYIEKLGKENNELREKVENQGQILDAALQENKELQEQLSDALKLAEERLAARNAVQAELDKVVPENKELREALEFSQKKLLESNQNRREDTKAFVEFLGCRDVAMRQFSRPITKEDCDRPMPPGPPAGFNLGAVGATCGQLYEEEENGPTLREQMALASVSMDLMYAAFAELISALDKDQMDVVIERRFDEFTLATERLAEDLPSCEEILEKRDRGEDHE